MSAVQKKEYTLEETEHRYNDIAELYLYAEELLGTVESKFIANPEAQLDIVEPLINELSDATDMLCEEFIFIAESKRPKNQNKTSKSRIELAFRKIYTALNDYQSKVHNVTKKAHGAIQNIADPIVAKIQRKVEQVIVIFMEFIQLSLQSIMNKTELDSLKQRDTRIALMLHQMTLAQHQS